MKGFIQLLSLLAAGILLLTAAGCKKDTPEGKSFTFQLGSDPKQLDPQVSTDRSSVTMAAVLFEGLARLDENGEAVPAAADWTVSSDGLVYTFTLRDSQWSVQKSKDEENVWKEATPVTAQDFVFGMQRAVSPSTGSQLAEELFCIQNAEEVNKGLLPVEELGVKALDEKTLQITLTHPDDGFPAKTTTTPYMPCNQAFFEYTGGRYGLEAEYILTNGPFYVKTWYHGETITLVKNEGYHEADAILPSTVRFTMTQVEDPVGSLEEGALDAATLTPDQAAQAEQAGLQLVRLQDTVQTLWLNNREKTLSDAGVRRGLRNGLEWSVIESRLTSEMGAAATGYVPPDAVVSGSEKYRTEENALVPPSLGREALNDFEEGLTRLGLESCPKLTLLCADDEASVDLARYILQSWQKNLSVYFELQALPEEELRSRVQVGNYQLAILSFTPSAMNALDVLMSYGGTAAQGNLAGYASDRFDRAVGSLTDGTPTREELETLEQVLWEDCPCIPLSFPTRYMGLGKTVSGLIVRPFNGGAFGTALDFRQAGKLKN